MLLGEALYERINKPEEKPKSEEEEIDPAIQQQARATKYRRTNTDDSIEAAKKRFLARKANAKGKRP